MKFIVIDTETTGLNGIKEGDKLLEVGMVQVDTERGTVAPIYDRRVRQRLSKEDRNSWVFKNTSLRPHHITLAPFGKKKVGRDLDRLLEGQRITAYNEEFDFDKFLEPMYGIKQKSIVMPCLMELCDDVPELRGLKHRHDDGSEHVSMKKAYKVLCPSDPANMKGGQSHRGCDDAVMEGYILIELHKRGYI